MSTEGCTSTGEGLDIKFARPKTEGQAEYVEAIRKNEVVIAMGPAGTGKTYLAVAMAVELLRDKKVKRIVLVRPAVEAGEKIGFLPGDIAAKVNPYLRPLFDALNDFMEPVKVKSHIERGVIELASLGFMRGRTLSESVVILDEGQNSTVPQMVMLLTRLGRGSKMIVTGDDTQVDLPKGVASGLADAAKRLAGIEGIGVVRMQAVDIVRHPLVQKIVNAYGA